MRRLLFESLTILSKTEKKARKINFKPATNVILGKNDVGKSTLIKSLYHTLGADTPMLNNNRWRRANSIYCLRFSIDDSSYAIVRDDRYFGLFGENDKLLGQFVGIGGKQGIGARMNELLSFNIELETKNDDMRQAPPAYYYLPFYVDQDEGWNTPWASFSGLVGIKDYRKNMVEYHLGIRPQLYYDVQRQIFDLNKHRSELWDEKDSLIRVRDSYRDKKKAEAVDLDPARLKVEAEELVRQYNSKYSEQQDILALIKDARNRRLNEDGQIDVLTRAIVELDADYKFAESPSTADVVDCPMCGTAFANSIAERFGILDDIDYCRDLKEQRQKAARSIDVELDALNQRYSSFSAQLTSLEELLNRRRDEISLADIVRSEGYKDVLKSISEDITSIDQRQVELENKISELDESVRVDKELKADITQHYRAQMKDALNRLNVHVLSEDDYKSVDRVIKNNAIGSDLPRALLAQYMSYLQTMRRFNNFTLCPLVIDSPLQQEQDDSNATAIFDFIFESRLESQQLILGTVSSPEWNERLAKDNTINAIVLDTKFGLLLPDEYEDLLSEVGPLHEQTIASDRL